MLWKIRKRKKKKGPRVAIAIGVTLLVFTIFGFFVAPPIIKSQLEKRAGESLGRKVTVGRVRVNPYALSLTLENLDVRRQEDDGSLLGWRRLYVNFDPIASVLGAWTFGIVELDGFHGAATLKKDGTFDFADIIARLRAQPEKEAKPIPAIRVKSLAVRDARLHFADQSQPLPFATTLGPVSFELTEFYTAVERGAPYRFTAVTETGEKLAWTGTLSAAPLASTGELRLENVSLPKYAPYYADRMLADLTSGKISISGRYEAKIDGASRVMKLMDGALQLRDVKLVERANQESLVELPALDVTGVEADAVTMKARIGSVVLTGGHVFVRRDVDGSINLLNLLLAADGSGAVGGALRPDPTVVAQPSGPKAPPAAEPKPVTPAPLPDFLISEVSVKDFSADVRDLAAPRPAQLAFTGGELSLKNVTLAEGAEIPLQLALGWLPEGSVKVTGTVSIKPALKAALQTEVTAFALLPLSPYLEQFINARIAQGGVSTSGTVHVVTEGGTPTVIFDGNASVEKLGLVDGAQNEELAGFASLAINGLTAITAPQLEIALAEVTLTAPYARVLVNKDGALNLATLAKTKTVGGALRPDGSEESGRKARPTGEQAARRPKITVGKVVITDGDFSFGDRSVEPNVRMAITQFGGIIAGLSSENLARADVDLKATVNGSGPVAITGKLDPLGVRKFVDVKADLKNVDLLPLSPYSGKYAGFEIARGQLNLDAATKLDDKQLDAKNVIILNQFTFGAAVQSPDATSLPVRLGVALLKDANGQIVLDVPVSGQLDDPSLHLGKVVGRVIGNLLTKAATSPFALLGSMFGGGGDELAFQEFAPGASELLPTEAGKLATMTKALANRPGLSLGIEGSFDGRADADALKQRKLADLVRGKIWEEKHATDPNIAPPDQLEIAPEVHAAMVRKLFDEKFPAGKEPGATPPSGPVVTAPPPAPVIAAPPPPVKKGIIRRVVEFFIPAKSAPPPKKAAEVVAPPADAALTGPTLEEMTSRLTGTMEVTDNDLRALADARAQRVRDYFLNEGKISADRLFLASGNAAAKENKGPRVFLSLQ